MTDRSEVELIQVKTNDGIDSYIELECNWNIGIGGSLWTSGRLLVDYLSRNENERNALANCNVLELGSGTGLVGIAMTLMGPSSVTMTDLESHVDALKLNLERNRSRIPSTTKTHVQPLDWNTFSKSDAEELKPVDWIVGTDIAYQREFYAPLLQTLELLVTNKTRILVGLGRHDTDMRFFRMLVDAGYEYYKIPDEKVGPEFRGKDFGLFDIRKRQED